MHSEPLEQFTNVPVQRNTWLAVQQRSCRENVHFVEFEDNEMIVVYKAAPAKLYNLTSPAWDFHTRLRPWMYPREVSRRRSVQDMSMFVLIPTYAKCTAFVLHPTGTQLESSEKQVANDN